MMAGPRTSSPPPAVATPQTQTVPTETVPAKGTSGVMSGGTTPPTVVTAATADPSTSQTVTDFIEAVDNVPEASDSDADSTMGDEHSSFTASITSSIVKYRTLNGRTYHSDSIGDHYWGSNDQAQNNLLDIGHHVLTLLLDGKLYGPPLKEPIERVLDLGTGTGSWAIDFADAHPEAEIIGTDISPIQPTWVPPNVKLCYFSMIDDFNKPWLFPENHFDFIHIRWVPGTVHDWKWLFEQAYRTLKPGGWLESLDNDGFFRSDDGTMSETTATYDWKRIAIEGAKNMGLKPSICTVLDDLTRPAIDAAGFVNISETSYKVPYSEWPKDPKLKEIGLYCRAMLETDTEGMIGRLANAVGFTPEQTTIYSALVRKEMRSLNVHAYYCAKQVYGQKPEA
ncbi:methyltransferase type 12 [Grosmannia clavigera kw1407]|uniref:Methyltransferase type 12 n=1 Tax=Grosmannia clavigera (strain kw1407 / UAMH 11150) TaxID=655863 RepID=F0X7I6_GROCL|nr:methyltransferase type 12 [Grosmannia clavigera kw1407]EFX06559.1 methyltransferase type 12 [Grosmannia clavigera kw1407]